MNVTPPLTALTSPLIPHPHRHLAALAPLTSSPQVLLQGVRKSYGMGLFRPPVAAVRGLWAGVPAGECFGLLGVNGAGEQQQWGRRPQRRGGGGPCRHGCNRAHPSMLDILPTLVRFNPCVRRLERHPWPLLPDTHTHTHTHAHTHTRTHTTCTLTGKTTTFRMLTGEVAPDAGDARVGGASVRTQLAAARRLLGYCPQFEALPGAMTGREVATMYARWAVWVWWVGCGGCGGCGGRGVVGVVGVVWWVWRVCGGCGGVGWVWWV